MTLRHHALMMGELSAPAGSWHTVFSLGAEGVSSGGWSGYTIRTVIDKAYLPGACTKARLTFRGSGGGGSATSKVYLGEAAASGDAYDFLATPTQVLFSGSAGFSGLASGVELLSDELIISISGGSNLVYGHLSGAAAWGASYSPGAAVNFSSILSSGYHFGDEAATVNATTGYTPNGAYPVVKLEVFG